MNKDLKSAENAGEPEDLGEPIQELKVFQDDVSPGFLSRVLAKLRRRSLVNQFATMTWTASAHAFFEFLGMIFSIFDPGKPQKKEGRTNG